MNALIRWSLVVISLLGLMGCPEKKPEGGGAAPAASSSETPAKTAPGSGGW
jgi:hypothetical protein